MTDSATLARVVIMGAAGRDFHNFNVRYRGDPSRRVVAFTAAQMAGARYPDGIPIVEEESLADLCREQSVARVVFAYSDVRHEDVMHKASVALAAGVHQATVAWRQWATWASEPSK